MHRAIGDALHVAPSMVKTKQMFVLGSDAGLIRTMNSISNVVLVATVEELLNRINCSIPGCVVVDCETVEANVFEIQDHIWQQAIGFPMIAVCPTNSPIATRDFFQAGVADVLHKPLSFDRIRDAILHATQRDEVGSPSARMLRSHLSMLTERERQVLHLCLQGLPAKAVAKQLGITFQTVDKHRVRVLKKMNAGSLLELVNSISKLSQNALLNFV